jgi:hypothetical protein
MKNRVFPLLLGAVFTMMIVVVPVWADVINIDEKFGGFEDLNDGLGFRSITGYQGVDPAPGGRGGVLIYDLPFVPVAGDVLLIDPPGGISNLGDILRFGMHPDPLNPMVMIGHVIFYSLNDDFDQQPPDAADGPLVPFQVPNFAQSELGMEGNNGAHYVPANAASPGFAVGRGVTYNFFSDNHVLPGNGPFFDVAPMPEPSSFVLLAIGIAGVGFILSTGMLRRRA